MLRATISPLSRIRSLDWVPEAVLLLNPDAVPRPGAISIMLQVMRSRPRIGFVGPTLEHIDGSTWVGAFNFPSFGTEVWASLGIDCIARRYPLVVPAEQKPRRVDWVAGTAVLVRWEAIHEIGDMDDGYFLYFEEVDYMLQGARIGWESWHAPDALVLHEAGASTGIKNGVVRGGRMPAYWFQSWGRFFAKNYSPFYSRVTAVSKLIAIALGEIQRRFRGRDSIVAKGFLSDFARNVAFAQLSPPPKSDRALNPIRRPAIR